MIYRHRRRPRNLAQKIRLALLSQVIGLGDLSGLLDGLTTVVRPRRQYRRLLAPYCATCGYSIAIADILSSFGTPARRNHYPNRDSNHQVTNSFRA